ncbi:MAG: carboxyl transferase domain-containing protein [Antricoccus sp.]
MDQSILIANRGEIAIRIASAAAGLGLRSVAVYSADDADSLHVQSCDDAVALVGTGPAAYLDVDGIIRAAIETGATLLHPGYGFLSENPKLAAHCAREGIQFVGPPADALSIFGDKAKARALAVDNGIPVLPGIAGRATVSQMQDFVTEHGTSMIKAIAGGGGRGMRVVRAADQVPGAAELCAAEAQTAFGSADLYIERYLESARHVEVQVIADISGAVSHTWDRDCSVQRRHQKLIEIAPSATGSDAMREAAVRLISAVDYLGLATVEFLVAQDGSFYFMETNPRLQVEHTVTEEVTGIDLVQSQIEVCRGRSLGDLGLDQARIPAPSGIAIQVRINSETMQADGSTVPHAGTIAAVQFASGKGIRLDSAIYPGCLINPRFDSMIAKLITHTDTTDLAIAARMTDRALAESAISGVATNLSFQRAILRSSIFTCGAATTDFVDLHAASLLDDAPEERQLQSSDSTGQIPSATLDAADAYTVRSPMSGVVVSIEIAEGVLVRPGQTLVVLESMKMQHVITIDEPGNVTRILVEPGDVVSDGQAVVAYVPADIEHDRAAEAEELDPDYIRPDLAKLIARKEFLWDANRPKAVAKRHKLGKQTARENVEQLIDAGSLVEYGALAIAAQRKRRSVDDLIENTPADGLITGIARIDEAQFGRDMSTCAVFAYDYTVLAGTQGYYNHNKSDRLFDVALRNSYPVILLCEGGGGRPGEVDTLSPGLHYKTWHWLGQLNGQVPLVGVVSGRCFAGNAAILGVCDVIIATKDSNIGMGGPAMIEGGGLGLYRPEDIGPIDVQTKNGVVDIVAEDEIHAIEIAKRYLAYFQGDLAEFQTHDQRKLRHVVPENRKRVYDIRAVIELLFDVDSVLELRCDFGTCMVTALTRLEGRTVGVIANNPVVLGGAIDSDGADKAARFLELCDAFGFPVVSLCDTPGFMVGPDAEKTASVRKFSRLFIRGASMSVPLAMVVVRKGYGLGAMAMGAGSLHIPTVTLAWPTSEFGGMGLEGAVRLGFRKELEAVTDPVEREALFEKILAEHYEVGNGLNAGMLLQVDGVIDPADTRQQLVTSLRTVAKGKWTNTEHKRSIDTW